MITECANEIQAAYVMAGDCVCVDGSWVTIQDAAPVGGMIEIILPDNTGVTFQPTAYLPVAPEGV